MVEHFHVYVPSPCLGDLFDHFQVEEDSFMNFLFICLGDFVLIFFTFSWILNWLISGCHIGSHLPQNSLTQDFLLFLLVNFGYWTLVWIHCFWNPEQHLKIKAVLTALALFFLKIKGLGPSTRQAHDLLKKPFLQVFGWVIEDKHLHQSIPSHPCQLISTSIPLSWTHFIVQLLSLKITLHPPGLSMKITLASSTRSLYKGSSLVMRAWERMMGQPLTLRVGWKWKSKKKTNPGLELEFWSRSIKVLYILCLNNLGLF